MEVSYPSFRRVFLILHSLADNSMLVLLSSSDYVYAAYGDLLHVWNATDGTNGMSTTKMPYEENNQTYCSVNYPMPEPVFLEESPPEEVKEREPDSTENDRRRNCRNRHLLSISWDPCY